jgi:hypothetical protein
MAFWQKEHTGAVLGVFILVSGFWFLVSGFWFLVSGVK